MRVAVYARVSTSDKNQDPESQLMVLRDYCQANSVGVYAEYVDRASANDFVHQVQWRKLQDDIARRKIKSDQLFKLDRAFRSVKHMHDTVEAWEIVGVEFISLREQFDTSTVLGRLLRNFVQASLYN